MSLEPLELRSLKTLLAKSTVNIKYYQEKNREITKIDNVFFAIFNHFEFFLVGNAFWDFSLEKKIHEIVILTIFLRKNSQKSKKKN